MPIKNKDGSTFELRGPNPAMNQQTRWDPDEVVLHNFRWKGVVVRCGHEGTPLPQPQIETEPTIADELFEPEVVQAQEVHVPVEVQEEVQEPPPPPKPKPVDAPKPKPKVTAKLRVHCLPASIADYSDDLYGQSYKTIQYGEKFIADAGITNQGDLEATFWSADDRITEGSILYPMTMEKRWWKVVEVEERPLGGNLLYCQISEKQPRFD
jgi:hypothetical protein